jgi:predicted DNA-binding transcriptional regulator AlpA
MNRKPNALISDVEQAQPKTQPTTVPVMPEDLKLLSAKDVTALLGVSESWLWAQLQKGVFPEPLRLGRRCTRWRTRDIRDYLDQRAGPRES